MKAPYFILILVVAVLSQPMQEKPQTNYSEARGMLTTILDKGSEMLILMGKKNLDVSKIDVDVIGLASTKRVLKTFSSDYNYVIAVVGQPIRILEMYVEVRRDDGAGHELLVAYSKTEENPTVTFTPKIDGEYIIIIKVTKMSSDQQASMGYYFMAVAHD